MSLVLICGALVCVVATLVFLDVLSVELLTGARAYMQGEALWSKGQKDAVVQLCRYKESRSEEDYRKYLEAIRVPVACRQIRVQLARPQYDLATLTRALDEVGIHPDDRDPAIWLYRYSHWEPHFKAAVSRWAEGDLAIDAIQVYAERLHSQIKSGATDEDAVKTLSEIHRIDAWATPLEVRFTQSIADASRFLHRLLIGAFCLISAILVLAGSAIYFRLLRRITDSEQKHRHLIDTASEAILVLDGHSGAVIDANRRAEELLGNSVRQSAGAIPLFGLDSKAAGEPGADELRRLIGTKRETRMRSAQGAWIDVEFTASEVPVRGNTLIEVILHDVTQERKAAEALRESEQRYRQLFERNLAGVYRCLPDGRLIDCNTALLRMLGYDSVSELTALSPSDVFYNAADLQAIGETLLRERLLTDVDLRLKRKDGGLIWVLENISLTVDDNGAPVFIDGTVVEITDRKNAEIEAIRAKEAAEAASRAKSEFLANMSHEIRTPLNGVMGMLALAAATHASDEQQECLATARTSAAMLKNVLDDVLDVSKIEAGRLELEPLRIDIRAIAEDCIRTFRAQAQQKGLELVLADLSGLPATLVGDPVRLRQVISNLVGNAVKFTDRGRVGVAAEVESSTAEEVVVKFSVADTGIGISGDNLAVIFEPFRQADGSSTRLRGGTGLGLTISARLVELMGGKIAVESEKGKGSTFWFTARFRFAAGTEFPAAETLGESQWDTEVAEPLRILLAEDNPVNQRLAVRLLERNGHTVRVAHNGQEAVAFSAEEAFDLILMDVQMPKMDGYAATRLIREREGAAQHVPIIAMTACTMKGDREKCLGAGMDAYVPKPIDIDALLAVIAKLGAATPIPPTCHQEPA